MAIPTFGKRTQPPDREHPCSCRANPCIRARVLLYVIAMSRYLRKTWKNPKGVPKMPLPDLAAIDYEVIFELFCVGETFWGSV